MQIGERNIGTSMNSPISFDEYVVYANSLGTYDNLEIQTEYALYLAILTNDVEIIKKAMLNYHYNTIYRILGKLN